MQLPQLSCKKFNKTWTTRTLETQKTNATEMTTYTEGPEQDFLSTKESDKRGFLLRTLKPDLGNIP